MVYGATQSHPVLDSRVLAVKESLAQELLMKLPVSKPTHIVKAGLKGRLIYAFKSLIPKFGFWGLGSRNSASPVAISRVSSV